MSSSSLLTLLEIWQAQLKDWAAGGSISKAARSALALEGNQPLLQELESAFAAGDFSGLPPIELLPASSMPGAAGAFAASAGTIYLNEDWLLTATEEAILSVLTEELGAFPDDQLNTVDTQGDEGALFSAEFLGIALSDAEVSAIQAESDNSTISVDGQELQAEANSIFPAVFELSSLDGSNGFRINGIDGDDNSGYSVSGAGDVNGDGIDDLIIGAPNAGQSYVVYGRSATLSETVGTVIEAGNLDDGTATSGTPSISGQLTASDVDADASLSWSIGGTTPSSGCLIQAGGTRGDIGYDITALAGGSSFVTGSFRGTATFGTTTLTSAIDSRFGTFPAAFIAKLNPDGTWGSVISEPSTTYGSIAIDPDTGKWTFNLDNSLAATQALKEGQSATETFTARVTDEFGASADQTITVNIEGANDALPPGFSIRTETIGNTSLLKASGYGYVQVGEEDPTAITNSDGTTLGDNTWRGWKLVGAETINEVNTSAWLETSGQIWFGQHDANWRVNGSGSYASSNSAEFFQAESNFNQDFNQDSMFSDPFA